MEQFLATTSKAAAEEEGANGGMDHGSTLQLEQASTQPSRKKRQLDSVSSHSGSVSTQSTVQYQPSMYAVPMQTTAFAQQPILTPTLSMMTSPELMNGTGYAFDYNNQQQQQQQTPVTVSDLKEQQKQQQLKIQQQHRLYQMQTFGGGAGAVKVEPTTDSLDLHKVEQQQQLQQQLLRQQLQRQQQQQQMEMSMKDQIAGGNVHTSALTAQSPNLAAPVIPSHRHALQMLQQQQQQQHSFQHSQQHLRQQHQQPVTMPLTMTMTSLSMEAQQKMSQEFQLNSMIASSAGYDPSQFWMDFSGGAGDRPSSAAGGNGLTSVGLDQEGLRIATTAAGEGQFGSNSSLWI